MPAVKKINEIPHLTPSLCFLAAMIAYTSLYAVFISPQPLAALHQHWTTTDDIEFGYLLLALTAFFLFKNLNWSLPTTDLRLTPILFIIGFLLTITDLAALESVSQLLIYLGAPFYIALLYGRQKALAAIQPLLILMMALPIWYLVSPILQSITVAIVSTGIDLSSMQASVKGNYINVPTGIIHVAEGCSGLKYFLSALSLTFIAYNIETIKLRDQIKLTLTAALLAIIANWVRVFILVVIGYSSGIDHPLMSDHDNLGWYVFAVIALAPYLFIHHRVTRYTTISTRHTGNTHPQRPLYRLLFTALIALCALSLPKISTQLWLNTQDPHEPETIVLPLKIGNTQQFPDYRRDWYPIYPPSAYSAQASYLSESGRIFNVSTLRYSNTGKGVEMINKKHKVVDPSIWKISQPETVETATTPVQMLIAKSQQRQRLILYWYDTAGNTSTSAVMAKLHQLVNYGRASTLVAVSTVCSSNCLRAKSESLEFSGQLHKQL